MSTTPDRRPSAHSDAINQAVAKRLAPKVLSWLNEPGVTVEEVQKDLEQTLDFQHDGYALARDLERQAGYDPDAALVEILDEVSTLRHSLLNEATAAWVKSRGLQEPAVGSSVKFDHRGYAYTGIVKENLPNGKSVVYCPGLGHVQQGTGTHGIHLDWENLQPSP